MDPQPLVVRRGLMTEECENANVVENCVVVEEDEGFERRAGRALVLEVGL